MGRLGIMGDTQYPASHPGYLDFCLDTWEAWDCVDFLHIGDLVDMHNQAFHDRVPDMPGSRAEYDQAFAAVQDLRGYIPNMTVLRGNHDMRALRCGHKLGLIDEMLVPLTELWGVPDWKYADDFVFDGMLAVHGDGVGGGMHPAANYLRKTNDYSVAMGHFHTRAGISWLVGPLTRRFGMDVGCGIDRLNPAMKYDRKNPLKPVLACAVLIDGHPYQELMPCGPGEKYHRSNFS